MHTTLMAVGFFGMPSFLLQSTHLRHQVPFWVFGFLLRLCDVSFVAKVGHRADACTRNTPQRTQCKGSAPTMRQARQPPNARTNAAAHQQAFAEAGSGLSTLGGQVILVRLLLVLPRDVGFQFTEGEMSTSNGGGLVHDYTVWVSRDLSEPITSSSAN